MFPPERYPQLLVGLSRSDDAAVYRVQGDLALIATLDFITPIVDDPYTYGAIAAANAMSDVYAMGGRVALALNVSCLSRCLPPEIIAEIYRGGADKVREAGGVLAGGHSIDDREPKYGLVALGFVAPDEIMTKAAARPGDVLILTKPLGVGIITTAFKGDAGHAPEHLAAATASMLELSRVPSELLRAHGVRAGTDVTGFALVGHAYEMADRSGVQLAFQLAALPIVSGAAEYADLWLFPGGTGNNKQAYLAHTHFASGIAEETQNLLLTPETSGPLLAAVPPDRLAALRSAFAEADQPLWVVGEVRPRHEGEPRVVVE